MFLIYRHLLKATAGPFLFGLSVATFVLLIDYLYRYVELFVEKGVPFLTATEFLVLSLGFTFALSVPMAILIGVLMGVGQLAADHEIVAFKASGVGLDVLYRPLLGGAALVMLLMTAYNHFVFPEWNHRLANLLTDITRSKPLLEIRPQVFAELNDRVTIWVADKDDRTGELRDVRILEKRGPDDLRPRLTTATRGRLVPRPAENAALLELEDGEVHSLPEDNDPGRYDVVRFQRHNLVVRNAERGLEDSRRTARGDREMDLVALWREAGNERRNRREILRNTAELTARLTTRQWSLLDRGARGEALTRGGGEAVAQTPAFRAAAHGAVRQEVEMAANSAGVQVQILASHRMLENRFMVEFHKKFAIPFACLVFVLLGLPLAVTAARAGRGVSAAVATGMYLVYYLFLIGGEKLSDRGLLDPFLAMWAANIVLTAIGVPLAVRAVRESGPLRWRRLRLAPAPGLTGPGGGA